MLNQVVFTCRVPQAHRTVFENYITIQILAAQADGTVSARDPINKKKMMTFTTTIRGASLTLVERARSRISARAIELAQIKGG